LPTSSPPVGGILLIAATVVALLWANSPWGESYAALWQTKLTVGLGEFSLSKDLTHWINDALMAVFFLVVGLEIKRELLVGELSSVRSALYAKGRTREVLIRCTLPPTAVLATSRWATKVGNYLHVRVLAVAPPPPPPAHLHTGREQLDLLRFELLRSQSLTRTNLGLLLVDFLLHCHSPPFIRLSLGP
jgi:Na+/H+ antiporter 1